MDTSKERSVEGVFPERGAGPGAQEIRASLERILQSRLFRSAAGQREFLRFTVEETLAGRGHNLKEFVVGSEAFGRGDAFDPRVDPIVRTEARKLRTRLARFYESEGSAEPVRFELPKGSYVPSFHYAQMSSEPEPIAPLGNAATNAPSGNASAVVTHTRIPIYVAVASVACLLLWSRVANPGPSDLSISKVSILNRSGDQQHDNLSAQITASLQRLLAENGQAGGKPAELHGTLQKRGSELRLRLRLVHLPRTSPIWSGSYELQPAHPNDAGNEIADEVSQVLRQWKP